MNYAVDAAGLVKRYGSTAALDDVSFVARTGAVLGMLGPNGAGKTTAVRVLATLLRPDAGRASVAGFDVLTQAHQVRLRIALAGQYAAVDESLTGTENLLMLGRLLGASRPAARQRAAELLDRFGLTDAAGRATKTYSGGMRRRLDLAASLVGRPEVLFLDEPTTGLDPRSRGDLWDIVRGLVADGVTVVLTTQYLEEADRLADDLVVVDSGRIVARGTPDALKRQVGGQVLALRPVRPDRLTTVVEVLTELTGVAPHVADGLVSTPAQEAALMPEAVRRLADVGVLLDELTLRRPSLDEVFLALTGAGIGADERQQSVETDVEPDLDRSVA